MAVTSAALFSTARETRAQIDAAHPCVASAFGLAVSCPDAMLAMPLYPRGSLSDVLEKAMRAKRRVAAAIGASRKLSTQVALVSGLMYGAMRELDETDEVFDRGMQYLEE